MGVNSFVNMVPGSNRFPLTTTSGDLIFTGGHEDPRRAGLSPKDIERVRALYTPVHIPPQQDSPASPASPPLPGRQAKRYVAANNTQSAQPLLRVEVSGGLNATEGPVPTQTPVSANSSKAMELAEKYAADLRSTDFEEDMVMPVRPVSTVQPSVAPAANRTRTTKRWYSVPEAQDAAVEALRPWPPGQDGRRVVTWCFEDQASSNALGTLLAWGRQSWETVLHNPEMASLYFENDSACGAPRGPCLCTTNGVSEVSLRISMGRPGQTEFDSTLGYRDPIVANPHPNRPRHWLKWPSEVHFFGEASGMMMAHLLGEIPPLTFRAWSKTIP